MFAVLGHYEIEVKVDSMWHTHYEVLDAMKHIDARILWLQDLTAAGCVRLKKIPRKQNLADLLTHTTRAKELEVFPPLMNFRSCIDRDKEFVVTKQHKPVPVGNAKVYSRC